MDGLFTVRACLFEPDNYRNSSTSKKIISAGKNLQTPIKAEDTATVRDSSKKRRPNVQAPQNDAST